MNLKNIDQPGLEISMKIPYDFEYLLPSATKMKHQGGQSIVYETSDKVLKIMDGPLPNQIIEINDILKRIDPMRLRYMWSDKIATIDGNRHYYLMPKFNLYHKDYDFSRSQKNYLQDSLKNLYTNGISGLPDIKQDNLVYSDNIDEPVMIDIDTGLIEDTPEHVVNSNRREDLLAISDL